MAKYCPKCGKKVAENDVFCSKCGARVDNQEIEEKTDAVEEKLPPVDLESENTSPAKKGAMAKLEYMLKAKERSEKEKQEIILKSTLQKNQLEGLAEYPTDNIKVEFYKDFEKFRKKTIAEFAILIFAIIAFAALCFVLKYLKISDTLKVILLLLVFLSIFTSFAFATDRFYRLGCIKYFQSSGKGIRKISYGKPPLLLRNGKLYTVQGGNCLECGTSVHIEELEESEVVVCDNDRTHIALINISELENKISDIDLTEKIKTPIDRV